MKVRTGRGQSAIIEFERDELESVERCVAETLRQLTFSPEYRTRVGVDREVAEQLLARLRDLVSSQELTPPTVSDSRTTSAE